MSRLFQFGECGIPEVKMQYFTLPRQEVIFDIETIHRLEMTAKNSHRNQISNGRSFTGCIFNGMQSLGANLQILLVLLVPLRDAGVEVPAVVIKARLA